MQEWCLLSSDREILEQTFGTSSLVTLSNLLQKQLDRQWSEIFPAAPVLLLSPFIDNFPNTVTPDYLCFPLPPALDPLVWLLLTLVAIPTINQ